MNGETLEAHLPRPQHEDERIHADNADSAGGLILMRASSRESLRAAKRQQRAALRAYVSTIDTLTPRQQDAIHAYVRALSAEAAANRADARELAEYITARESRTA